MVRVDIPGSTFGEIPGCPVGTRWEDRDAMMEDHIHPMKVAGIYGRKADGARSVVLNGEFEDEDHGETFVYIGSGGRAPEVRFGPQTCDQSLDKNNLNQSLVMSAKRQTPVRVIRGSGLKSKFAPYAGFRYDGLYTVHNVGISILISMSSGVNASVALSNSLDWK
ncbi:hypothetical protein NM688_g6429 [Phlebia brevispora]|uniref:Uncharacterized protein n=1 Tax=Phlebia brevispora TaxID=194682 RepID=A0ACC1SGB9_9APHY|nr:hypothetical protein NM688_g6429 [Phlebia brevispora]